MTEMLDYLREKGELGDEDLARCVAYLSEYGTDAAKAWAAARA
jgi:hypothetical protein